MVFECFNSILLAIILGFNFSSSFVRAQDAYTIQELEILPKFREIMKNSLTQDIMYENKYLIRFLRARKLNLKEAQKMMEDMLEWRKKYDIDNILKRNFSEFEKDYPVFYSVDKNGRPATSSSIGLLNPRQLLLAGKRDELRDYFHYLFEKGVMNLHRVSNETGKEFIEGYLLADMAGYSLRTHGCLPCLRGWIDIALGYERHYPQLAHRIIVVNTPRIFESVFQTLKPFITKHTRNAILLFGYDRTEWSKILNNLFEKDQLLVEFGGTAKHNTNIKLF